MNEMNSKTQFTGAILPKEIAEIQNAKTNIDCKLEENCAIMNEGIWPKVPLR